tara:strand:+ start:4048 stop:4251 length:204 start_codon:yes stop_codon:yes gene_type:complete
LERYVFWGGNMLVLSRRVDESLVIDKDVKITVLDIKGGQVRLGITAPSSVKVHREEVFNRINDSSEE